MSTFLKALFGLLLFATAVAVQSALILFDFNTALTLLIIGNAASVTVFVLRGGRLDSAVTTLREIVVPRLEERRWIVPSICALLVLALMSSYGIFGSQLLMFAPDGDLDVEIYEVDGHKETFLGHTSKDSPLRHRSFYGSHTFVGRGQGLEDSKMEVSIGWSRPWFPDRHIHFPLKAVMALTFNDVVVDYDIAPGLRDGLIYGESMTDFPASAYGQYSQILTFNIDSPARLPLSLPRVAVNVLRVDNQKDWLMPYYNEPYVEGAEEGVFRGYVVLQSRKGTAIPVWKGIPRIGAARDAAKFVLRAFSDAGKTYHLRFEATCHDPNNEERINKTIVSPEVSLDFPNDWSQVIGPTSTLDIVYYCRAEMLAAELDRRKLTARSKLFIADPQAIQYLKEHSIKSSIYHRICNAAITKELIAILGSHPNHPDRPANCVIIDGTKMLVQKHTKDASLCRAEFVTDQKQIDKVRRVLARVK